MKDGLDSDSPVSVPPVAGAGGAAAGAQDALVQTIQLGSVSGALQELLVPVLHVLLVLPLQPGLDALVLLVEVVHVGHQVLHHVHVRERVDLGGLVISLDLGETSESIDTS